MRVAGERLPVNHGMRGRLPKYDEPTDLFTARLPRSIRKRLEREADHLQVTDSDVLVARLNRSEAGRHHRDQVNQETEARIHAERVARAAAKRANREAAKRQELARRLHALAHLKHRRVRALTPRERTLLDLVEKDPEGFTDSRPAAPPPAPSKDVPLSEQEIPHLLRKMRAAAPTKPPPDDARTSVSQVGRKDT